jgi:L-lactate dehydrogenase (cytochrome)
MPLLEDPMGTLVSVADYRRLARRRLPKFVFDFVDGGAGDETTVRANTDAFTKVSLHPHQQIDVSKRSTSTTVQGQEVKLPVLLAPTGLQRMVRRFADLEALRAAGEAGTAYVMSSASAFTIEEMADAASGPLWFQLYLWRSREAIEHVVARARAAGISTLVVTVDVPMVGSRERDRRNGMSIPPRITPRNIYEGARHPRWAWQLAGGPEITFANFKSFAPAAGGMALMTYANTELTNPASRWDDLRWLRDLWPGSIVVKGILTVYDAVAAVEAGADALIVSNHGGRQLDGVPATLDVLPHIVAGVPDHVEVLLDGGVRRGIDVARALALGARAVLIGRPYWWGLAAGGQAGVSDVLDIYRTELDTAMALCGRPTVGSIDRNLVDPAVPSRTGSVRPVAVGVRQ